MEFLWVGFGGFLGANARYALGTWAAARIGASLPYGTFLVNLTGSLLIGVLMTLLADRFVADPMWRLLLVTGFLGGYTTFSSYTYETLALVAGGNWLTAALYVLGSNGLGLVATYAGIVLARAVAR